MTQRTTVSYVTYGVLFVLAISACGYAAIGTIPYSNPIAPIDAPFDMPQLHRPVFADRTFDVRDYGAVADGTTKNTNAFASAIAACNKAGGGRVLVPSGTWLTGPVHFMSNVNLYLAKDAVLLFSTDFDDYLPVVFSRYEGTEYYNYSPMIYANGCTNIAITGAGSIDGQGKAWWPLNKKRRESAKRLYDMTRGVPVKQRIFGNTETPLRPSFVQPINCKNVLIEGITVGSGPMWTIHPVYCQNVIIRDITVITKGPNNDGVNPDSCRNVLIENCRFDTDDDAIAIKSGLNEDGWRVGRPCENIVIRNCSFGMGTPTDGVVSIGSEMSGDVRNVLIHDCHFDKTNRGIRIKSMRGRGGIVENIWIRDITICQTKGEAILLNTFYEASAVEPLTKKPPLFRNIHIKNIKCDNTEDGIRIIGLPEMPIENVTVENITLSTQEGIQCTDVNGIRLVNVTLRNVRGPLITLCDARNVTIEDSTAPEDTEVFLRVKGQRSGVITLKNNDLSNARTALATDHDVPPDAVTVKPEVSKILPMDFSAVRSPIIIKGDEDRAFRDPAAIYHNGTFYLYYTLWLKDIDGIRYSYTAFSKSKDLFNWTEPKIITPKDLNLNFSSPGNVIRFKDKWILCLQTYPTPDGNKYGNSNCRLWIMRSDDLENFEEPELLKVKGPDVPFEKMGRLIDAYLVEDKDTPGKWWCLFDDNAVNISYSYDLENWTYLKRVPAGENACVIVKDDEYILFHSPGNGIGVKRSKNMIDWHHVGAKIDKGGTGSITLGQKDWPWASQRLTAGFVLDLKDDPRVGKYLMFFHAEPPGGFKKLASLGIAWSDDLVTWNWPGRK